MWSWSAGETWYDDILFLDGNSTPPPVNGDYCIWYDFVIQCLETSADIYPISYIQSGSPIKHTAIDGTVGGIWLPEITTYVASKTVSESVLYT